MAKTPASIHPLRAPAAIGKLLATGRVAFQGLNIFSLQESNAFPMACAHALLGSDLWKPLNAAFGKCDGMVPGKYCQARQFSFQTPSFYVWCHTETGDRGTTWLMADKAAADAPLAMAQGSYQTRRPDAADGAREELGALFEQLFLGMAMGHPPTLAELRDVPIVKAYAEAAELRAGIAAPAPKASRKRAGI